MLWIGIALALFIAFACLDSILYVRREKACRSCKNYEPQHDEEL